MFCDDVAGRTGLTKNVTTLGKTQKTLFSLRKRGFLESSGALPGQGNAQRGWISRLWRDLIPQNACPARGGGGANRLVLIKQPIKKMAQA